MSSHDTSSLPSTDTAHEIHPCSGSQATELRGSSTSIQGNLEHHPFDGDGGDQPSTSMVKCSPALSLNAIIPGADKNAISYSKPEPMAKRAIEATEDDGGQMVKRQRLGSGGSSQHLTQQKVCGRASSPVEGIKEEILFLASLDGIPKKSHEGGIEGISAEAGSCDDDPKLSMTVPRRVAEACLVASGTKTVRPGVGITRAPGGAGPLSDDDIQKFEEDGFIMLKQAFPPTVAAEASSPKKRRGKPWTDALSPRLKSAVSQLVGAGAWEEFGCGWWVISFPGFASLPWGAEGAWHVDGSHFKHYPHRRCGYGCSRHNHRRVQAAAMPWMSSSHLTPGRLLGRLGISFMFLV